MPHDRVCPACKKRFGLDGEKGLCPESHFDKGERLKCPECYHGTLVCKGCPKEEVCDGTLICPKCPTCKGTGRRT